MSIYYDFYVAVRDKETKKFEHFPGLTYEAVKDNDGSVIKTKVHSILYRTGSFMPSNALDEFGVASLDDMDEELKNTFTYLDWNNNLQDTNPTYIPLKGLLSLPHDYIKKGYFLIEDIDAYENSEDHYTEDLFYDRVSAAVYANMCAKQIETTKEKDDEGFEHTKHGWKDYCYYAYPDYDSKEYLYHELITIANSFDDMLSTIYGWEESKKKEIVILNDIG